MAVLLFDQSSAKRIADVVKRVERGGAPPGRSGPTGNGNGPASFWAKLTAEDPDSAGNYKWTKAQIVGGVLTSDTPTSGDEYSAQEINGAAGLPIGSFVLMWWAGYDGGGAAAYLFQLAAASVLVQPTAAADPPGGLYDGYVWAPPDAIDLSSGCTAAAVGQQGAACKIFNLWEEGTGTNNLKFSDYTPLRFPGTYLGTHAESGLPAYAILGLQGKACTAPGGGG